MGVGLYSCEFRFHPSLAFVVKGKQNAKPGVLKQRVRFAVRGIYEGSRDSLPASPAQDLSGGKSLTQTGGE